MNYQIEKISLHRIHIYVRLDCLYSTIKLLERATAAVLIHISNIQWSPGPTKEIVDVFVDVGDDYVKEITALIRAEGLIQMGDKR